MAIHVRFDGAVTVLSGVARLMNDPRHFDALRDVRALLSEGRRQFVLELGGVRETGSVMLGLLTTLTRAVRNEGGQLVLANVSPQVERFFEEMRMDSYWDIFDDAHEAAAFLDRRPAEGG